MPHNSPTDLLMSLTKTHYLTWPDIGDVSLTLWPEERAEEPNDDKWVKVWFVPFETEALGLGTAPLDHKGEMVFQMFAPKLGGGNSPLLVLANSLARHFNRAKEHDPGNTLRTLRFYDGTVTMVGNDFARANGGQPHNRYQQVNYSVECRLINI